MEQVVRLLTQRMSKVLLVNLLYGWVFMGLSQREILISLIDSGSS